MRVAERTEDEPHRHPSRDAVAGAMYRLGILEDEAEPREQHDLSDLLERITDLERERDRDRGRHDAELRGAREAGTRTRNLHRRLSDNFKNLRSEAAALRQQNGELYSQLRELEVVGGEHSEALDRASELESRVSELQTELSKNEHEHNLFLDDYERSLEEHEREKREYNSRIEEAERREREASETRARQEKLSAGAAGGSGKRAAKLLESALNATLPGIEFFNGASRQVLTQEVQDPRDALMALRDLERGGRDAVKGRHLQRVKAVEKPWWEVRFKTRLSKERQPEGRLYFLCLPGAPGHERYRVHVGTKGGQDQDIAALKRG